MSRRNAFLEKKVCVACENGDLPASNGYTQQPLGFLYPCRHSVHLRCLYKHCKDSKHAQVICPKCQRGATSISRVTNQIRSEVHLFEDTLTLSKTSLESLIDDGNRNLVASYSPTDHTPDTSDNDSGTLQGEECDTDGTFHSGQSNVSESDDDSIVEWSDEDEEVEEVDLLPESEV